MAHVRKTIYSFPHSKFTMFIIDSVFGVDIIELFESISCPTYILAPLYKFLFKLKQNGPRNVRQ